MRANLKIVQRIAPEAWSLCSSLDLRIFRHLGHASLGWGAESVGTSPSGVSSESNVTIRIHLIKEKTWTRSSVEVTYTEF